MKRNQHRSSRLITVMTFGGWLMIPGLLAAQENPDQTKKPPATERPAAQAGVAENDGIPKAIRQLRKLQRQGKTEEAARLAERIRNSSADNPRVIAMLDAMAEAPSPKLERADRPDRPERPERPAGQDDQAKPERPARRDQATPPSRPPNRAGAAAPQRPAHPQRPMAGRGRPAAESAMLPRVRIHHLTAASRHLAAAGFEEMAAKVRAEIPKLIAEMRRADGNADPEPPADAALRAEVQRLRRENAELRNRQQRPPGREPNRGPRPADRD